MGGNLGSVRTGLRALICALTLGAISVGVAAEASQATAGTFAKSSKSESLVESARLGLASENGSELIEHGSASGTYDAPLLVKFTIHPTTVTAAITVYPRGGSISGTAQANYIVQNSTGYFGGTLTITHGTGTYRHVAGKALGFSGTINRYTFAATVKAHGEISF
jgi:hypothetical protein